MLVDIIICIGTNLLHDVFDFVLFTVQDDAPLLADLQVLKKTLVLKTKCSVQCSSV